MVETVTDFINAHITEDEAAYLAERQTGAIAYQFDDVENTEDTRFAGLMQPGISYGDLPFQDEDGFQATWDKSINTQRAEFGLGPAEAGKRITKNDLVRSFEEGKEKGYAMAQADIARARGEGIDDGYEDGYKAGAGNMAWMLR